MAVYIHEAFAYILRPLSMEHQDSARRLGEVSLTKDEIDEDGREVGFCEDKDLIYVVRTIGAAMHGRAHAKWSRSVSLLGYNRWLER